MTPQTSPGMDSDIASSYLSDLTTLSGSEVEYPIEQILILTLTAIIVLLLRRAPALTVTSPPVISQT